MDLESTIIRAESLFRRFQRTVETIDKQGNFPSAPQARNRKSLPVSSGSPPAGPSAIATGTDKGKQPVSPGEVQVISPELRSLLSRQVQKLDKEEIAQHGGGVGAHEK